MKAICACLKDAMHIDEPACDTPEVCKAQLWLCGPSLTLIIHQRRGMCWGLKELSPSASYCTTWAKHSHFACCTSYDYPYAITCTCPCAYLHTIYLPAGFALYAIYLWPSSNPLSATVFAKHWYYTRYPLQYLQVHPATVDVVPL
jgi:hypothetical protein